MKDYNALRERYLRDGVPIRLGGLASNLVRIRTLAANPAHGAIVADVLNESKCFIEWTAGDTATETAQALAELQRRLAHWQDNWQQVWDDPAQRAALANESRRWSERVLQMSGLLDL